MSFRQGPRTAGKEAGRDGFHSFLNCYLHVTIKSFLKLSLRNPDLHDLSHTSSANKAVSVASLTSGGSTPMPGNPDAPRPRLLLSLIMEQSANPAPGAVHQLAALGFV